MSAGSGQAVFLSYASQDAAAAKKICDTLRAAGVEVWFDQNELVGGDAWDQKIRKQIKECALFIPIMSRTTQGRREAYFRLEWKLADERTHLMARGTPFLLPVTIDATNDREALVPDSFLAVQWTKLPGGETPPAFAARVQKLLGGSSAGASLDDARAESGHGRRQATPPREKSAEPKWTKPILASAVIVIAVLAFTLVSRRAPEGAAVPPAISAPAPATTARPVSPARELVAKVHALLTALESTREDFSLAEEYCQRALKLDPDDGEVWAAYSQVHAAFGYRGWDTSAERREQTRLTAERAIRLAPHSVEARIAQAGAWANFGINRGEREKLLRDILAEEPDNKAVLRFLALTVLPKPGGMEEALALNERAAALPGGDPLALFNNARYLWQNDRPAEGYATLQRALAERKFTSGLVLKMTMETSWRGDLAAAEDTLREIPAPALQEDRANYQAGLLRYYQGNATGALEVWQSFPRDFYADFVYDGPKGFLLGLAYELDHRDIAARTEWHAALQEVNKRIAAAPNKPRPYFNQAFLLACLGEKAPAGDALRTYEQLAGIKYVPGQPMPLELAKIYARLGRLDEIFAHPPAAIALLRISPDFEALRADPRFRQLRDGATPAGGSAGDRSPAPRPTDDKSVAVLAFANLSDDKANEYFSDGVSEELLTVLQKIPGLKVSARTSAFSFKGKNATAQEIGRTLGVANLVEGSVRKAGAQVRITARLSRADTGEQLWSESYTRDLKDVFSVQTELAQAIVVALRAKLMGETGTEVRNQVASQVSTAQQGGTTQVEAHELYLQGKYFANQPSLANIDKAVDYFQRAVDADGSFALAWAALGRTVALQAEYLVTTSQDMRERFARARRAVDRALALDPNLADGYFARLEIQTAYDYDWVGARESTERTLALAPSNVLFISNASQLAAQFGDLEKGIRLGRQAAELDPVNAEVRYWLGRVYQMAGRLPEAEAEFRRAAELSPSVLSVHRQQSVLLVQQGRAEAAVAEARLEGSEWSRQAALAVACWAAKDIPGADAALARLIAVAADSAGYQVAEAYAFRGEADHAFEWLERAYLNRDSGMGWVRMDPLLKNLHGDPRWTAFVKRVGLSDEQLK